MVMMINSNAQLKTLYCMLYDTDSITLTYEIMTQCETIIVSWKITYLSIYLTYISLLPLAFPYANFGTTSTFFGIGWVILFFFVIRRNVFGQLPKFLGAKSKVVMGIGLVPKDLVLQAVGFCIVVDD